MYVGFLVCVGVCFYVFTGCYVVKVLLFVALLVQSELQSIYVGLGLDKYPDPAPVPVPKTTTSLVFQSYLPLGYANFYGF